MSSETSHFQTLKGLAFLLITIFGCWENLHGISRENVGKGVFVLTQKQPRIKTHTLQYNGTWRPPLPPVLTDRWCISPLCLRPPPHLLLAYHAAFSVNENTIIDTQQQKQSSNKDNSYSHYKDVLNREGWDHFMRVTVKHDKCIQGSQAVNITGTDPTCE